MNINRTNVILVFVVFFAIFPAAFIEPIDWLYFQLTGANYVDITKGMIAYFIYLPTITLLISLRLGYRLMIAKLGLRKNIMYIIALLLVLSCTVFRFMS